MKTVSKKTQKVKGIKKDSKTSLKGYPLYPPGEDIYNHDKKEAELDPENPSRKKPKPIDPEALNEKSFREDVSGGDLDVPGSELDDQQEDIGSEDEENNYYSIGGDSHTDLDENTGNKI